MRKSRTRGIRLLALPGLFLVAGLAAFLAYQLPPVHDRLAWRVDTWITEMRYRLHPPEQVVFVPQGAGSDQATIEAIVQATVRAAEGSHATAWAGASTPAQVSEPALATPASQAPTQPAPTPTPFLTPTITPTFAPLPPKVELTGIRHEYQQMNNCGPTTLSMALSFWGWQGDQRDTRAFLRPNFKTMDDKNVNPGEMVAYVESQAGLKALVRVGGDIEILKRLLAAGFPVVIEKGFQPPKEDWMGHYVLVSGYDDTRQRFNTQDAYIQANLPVPYTEVSERWWRDFNNIYLVVYPSGREGEVLAALGSQADPQVNFQTAAEKALQETQTLSGRDLYFAWYNLGTNRVALQDYAGAAQAYDQAFALYPAIAEKDRPWRMLWYQAGPYEAYYNTGRYEDVIALGNQTLNLAAAPVLEESFYWLGRAREATGDMEKAVYDYKKAVDINPTSTPARAELERLGMVYP